LCARPPADAAGGHGPTRLERHGLRRCDRQLLDRQPEVARRRSLGPALHVATPLHEPAALRLASLRASEPTPPQRGALRHRCGGFVMPSGMLSEHGARLLERCAQRPSAVAGSVANQGRRCQNRLAPARTFSRPSRRCHRHRYHCLKTQRCRGSRRQRPSRRCHRHRYHCLKTQRSPSDRSLEQCLQRPSVIPGSVADLRREPSEL
jgi:hypothetical protein